MDDAESYVRTDDESALATDDAESYVRTDEEQSLSFRTDEEAELYDGNPKVSSPFFVGLLLACTVIQPAFCC